MAYLDADGEVVGKPGDRSVEGFAKTNKALISLAKLEKKAGKGGPKVARGIFLAKLDLGRFDFAEAKASFKKLKGFSKEEKASVNSSLAGLEMAAIRKDTGRDSAAANLRYLEMYKGGRIPAGRAGISIWGAVQSKAEDDLDAKAYEMASAKMKDCLKSDKRYNRFYKHWEAVLKAIQDGDEIPKLGR